MFETLLLNMMLLMIPVLLFVVFLDQRKYFGNNSMLIFFSAVSMILCMLYPIRLDIGFIFDLRYIPFLMVALYGGYKEVLWLYLVLNIYRFMIGGEGTLQSLLFSTVILITVPWLSKSFKKFDTRKRVTIGIMTALYTMALYLLTLSTFFEELTSQFWELVLYSIATHVSVITINILMVERVIFNIKNREKYLQSERLHVLSELSASVSHEIRNPLTVTKGFLQLLKDSKNITGNEKEYIDFSLEELNRAEKIVSDFLAFAKPQSENMVYSNLKEEVIYVKNILTPYAKMYQVEMMLHFENELNKKYDKNQMKQCLLNLFKNGIESMKKDGGTLYIRVTEQGGNIIITVKDQGVGMTENEISQLGKPYYSTKKEGTGLGMLMVYGLISKMNGKITVESKIGIGTTFIIRIPG